MRVGPAWFPGARAGLPPSVWLIVFVGVGFSIALDVGSRREARRNVKFSRRWPASSWRSCSGPGSSNSSGGFDMANWGAEVRVPYYANPSTPALLPVPEMAGTSVILNVEEP